MAALAIKSSAVRWIEDKGIMIAASGCHHPRKRMIQ
jgi:hypothetical protein